MTLLGIDVSAHQGDVDWEHVAKSNIEFAMIRVNCDSTAVDRKFDKNVREALANGINVGVYHYSAAKTPEEAAEEAKFTLDLIKDYAITYPVAFDMERCLLLNNDGNVLNDIILAFCEEIEKAGYYAMFYASNYWLKNWLDPERLGRFAVWMMQWSKQDVYEGAHGMWQYSRAGKIEGIPTEVNLNLSYVNYAQLIVDNGLNHLSDNFIPPDPETVSTELFVGEPVYLNGQIYNDSHGSFPSTQVYVDRLVTITQISDTEDVAPYLLGEGVGWVREQDLTPYVYQKGDEVLLDKTPLFASYDIQTPSTIKCGNFFLYDGTPFNNSMGNVRYRIVPSEEYVEAGLEYVTGYVDQAQIRLAMA